MGASVLSKSLKKIIKKNRCRQLRYNWRSTDLEFSGRACELFFSLGITFYFQNQTWPKPTEASRAFLALEKTLRNIFVLVSTG